MLIASLVFDVLPDKRAEFVSAVGEIVESLRSSQGCLACRLVTDCENDNLFVMTSEWDGRMFLDRYLASAEFSDPRRHTLSAQRRTGAVDRRAAVAAPFAAAEAPELDRRDDRTAERQSLFPSAFSLLP